MLNPATATKSPAHSCSATNPTMTDYMNVIAFFGALAVVTVISSHLSMLVQPSNSTYCFLTFDTFCGFACLSLLMGCIDSLVETVLLFRAYHRKSTLDAAICAQCIDRLKSVRTTTISGPMVEQMLKSCQSCAPAVSTNPAAQAARSPRTLQARRRPCRPRAPRRGRQIGQLQLHQLHQLHQL